jgi:hypothetical protein
VFAAASVAASSKTLEPGTIVSLLGNLMWAASSYVTKDRTQEATMAFAGAIAGTLAPSFLGGGDDETSAALRAGEREFFARHDDLVDAVWEALGAAGLHQSSSCAAVNAYVWEFLFPQLTYEQSLSELAEQITG